MTSSPLDVDALLKDPSIKVVVTCGSGGVGKSAITLSFTRNQYVALCASALSLTRRPADAARPPARPRPRFTDE